MTIAADPARVERAQVDAVVGRITALGHEVVARATVKDDAEPIRERLGRWLDDPEIDAIIITCPAGAMARDAMRPLVTKLLAGVTDAALCGRTFVFLLEGAAPQTLLKTRVLPLFDPDQPHNLVGQMPRLGGIPHVVPVEKTNEGVGLSKRLPAVPQGRAPSMVPALVPAPPGLPDTRTPPAGVPRARPRTGANVVVRARPQQLAADPPTEPLDLAELDVHRLASGAGDAVTRPVDLDSMLPVTDAELAELNDAVAEPPRPVRSPTASPPARPRATTPPVPPAIVRRPATEPPPLSRRPATEPPPLPRRPATEPPPLPMSRSAPVPVVGTRRPTEPPLPLPVPVASAPKRDMFADPTKRRGISPLVLVGAAIAGAAVVLAVLYAIQAGTPGPGAVASRSAPVDAAMGASVAPAGDADTGPADAGVDDAVVADLGSAGGDVAVVPGPGEGAAREGAGTATRSGKPRTGTASGGGPVTRTGDTPVATGSATTSDAPRDVPENQCDEPGCVLSGYDRPCCEQYRPKTGGFAPRIGGKAVELDKAMVRAGTAKVKPRIVKCGEQGAAKGTVKITVKVAPDGAVTSAEVADAPDAALGACVANAMKAATFDATVNGGAFTVPFVF